MIIDNYQSLTSSTQLPVRGFFFTSALDPELLNPPERFPEKIIISISSVYHTKPVHYLNTVTYKIEWTEIDKDVYNVDSGEVKVLKFPRLDHIDKYNQDMGNIDLADQLRGSYCPDHWIRNRK